MLRIGRVNCRDLRRSIQLQGCIGGETMTTCVKLTDSTIELSFSHLKAQTFTTECHLGDCFHKGNAWKWLTFCVNISNNQFILLLLKMFVIEGNFLQQVLFRIKFFTFWRAWKVSKLVWNKIKKKNNLPQFYQICFETSFLGFQISQKQTF